MKYLLVVCARSKSTRLPLKHFQKVSADFSALEVLFKRVVAQCADHEIQLCLATTTNPEDMIFQEKSAREIRVFRGHPVNIPLRQLQAAEDFGADVVISIDGDDILTAPEAINEVIKSFEQHSEPHKNIFYTTGLPLGMNVSLYSVNLLRGALQNKRNTKLETGWGRIFQDLPKVEVKLTDRWDNYLDQLRFTLDYPEDLSFFQAIGQRFEQKLIFAKSAEIIEKVVQDHLYEINQTVIKQYWENFYKEKKEEELSEQ